MVALKTLNTMPMFDSVKGDKTFIKSLMKEIFPNNIPNNISLLSAEALQFMQGDFHKNFKIFKYFFELNYPGST